MKSFAQGITLFAALAVFCAVAPAATVPIGYVAWDVSFPGNAGEFDISNLSGPNSDPLPAFDFPITTLLNLSNLNLVVDFAGGSSETFGPASGYFSLGPDGESFNGTSIPIGGTNPAPVDATLTGTISPTTMTYNTDGSGDTTTTAILPTFSATIFSSEACSLPVTTTFASCGSLQDGDLAVIYATTTTVGPTVPEPGTWMLLGTGLLILMASRRKFRSGNSWMTVKRALPVLCAVAVLGAYVPSASATVAGAQVTLTAWTAPSSGAAGVTNVNITGSLFPAGTITPANVIVTFASACDGAAVTTTSASSVKKVIGTTDRVNVAIPTGLLTGDYFLTIADSAAGDSDFTTKTGSCAEVQVSGSVAVLNACIAGSSIGVLLPASGATGKVTAYVPTGAWEGSTTGIIVRDIESGSTDTTVATPNSANSCSSNPATGQTVCVANNTDVYLLSGTTLSSTLTSGSNATAGFSGGSCNNCGVALNANNNTAAINMGVSGSADGGIQILNLTTDTFGTPLAMAQDVSENISVDPTRSLILSAGESANFSLVQIQSDGSLLEFDSSFNTGLTNDSSAEDCSTGIGLAPGEFSNSVYLVNLNAITFNSPSAGQYTAPNALATLTTSYGFSAGLSGSAVAQGSGHLAMVTGEFGGDTFAVLELPATAGSGTPSLVDYAVAAIPNNAAEAAACGAGFSMGLDPHTDTAYTSPNTGDSYAVFTGYNGGPACLAVVDMTTVINSTLSPRGGGGLSPNDIAAADLPASAVTFFPL